MFHPSFGGLGTSVLTTTSATTSTTVSSPSRKTASSSSASSPSLKRSDRQSGVTPSPKDSRSSRQSRRESESDGHRRPSSSESAASRGTSERDAAERLSQSGTPSKHIPPFNPYAADAFQFPFALSAPFSFTSLPFPSSALFAPPTTSGASDASSYSTNSLFSSPISPVFQSASTGQTSPHHLTPTKSNKDSPPVTTSTATVTTATASSSSPSHTRTSSSSGGRHVTGTPTSVISAVPRMSHSPSADAAARTTPVPSKGSLKAMPKHLRPVRKILLAFF